MILLVFGGRNFGNWHLLCDTLDAVLRTYPIKLLKHGAHRGADTLADHWAAMRGVPSAGYPALWDELKGRAGPLRNLQMLRSGVDLAVGFPGGNGSANMAHLLREAAIPLWVIHD